MKRILLTTLLAGTIFSAANAQQRAHYSQYMTNKYVINPAVAGTGDWVDVKLGFRTQWVGLQDAPKTFYVTANTPIGRPHEQPGHHTRKGAAHQKHWHGVGTYIYQDATGPTSRQGFYGSYTYNMQVMGPFRIAMGLFAGTQTYKIDGSQLTTLSELQGVSDDPAILGTVMSETVPDVGFGGWAYTNDFWFGISAFQLMQNKLDWGINVSDEISKLKNHYFITGGIRLPANEVFTIVPSFLVKAITPAPVSVDLNVRVKYKVKDMDRFWGGLSYRSRDSFAALAGLTVPLNNGKSGMLDLGYSFDLTTSNLRSYNSGTHEIVVGYRFPLRGHIICASQLW